MSEQTTVLAPHPTWAAEVRSLARQKDAVLLAHNYQLPAIQDVADHTGDSLALSRIAARSSASTIVFCGVHFMAETAKILAPDKTVLIPDARAGCSLADSITAEQLRTWKAEHPGAVVVSYVNTTAEVKAELLHLVQRGGGRRVDPRRQGGVVPPRPVPRRPRAASHRTGEHARLGR
jgi:quinolinate synthase